MTDTSTSGYPSQPQGPTHEDDYRALLRLADLMDEDLARTGHGSIPASYGTYLVGQAVSGTSQQWDAEWLRLLRTDGMKAATTWAKRSEEQEHRLNQLVYPAGASARPVSAADVRTIAATLHDQQTSPERGAA